MRGRKEKIKEDETNILIGKERKNVQVVGFLLRVIPYSL